ncbi:Histidinol dehydrogenase [Metallosphaera sp. J1]|uniref:histidinol dehydrogenase n=1 Tax=Metallosphaera TaxID=41980 RepID=UPI001EDF25C6|nr:histidinol dehydrogenase [Metallosphaera javensis (ex Hofmann et al. 2022)]MCG3108673.1 Histidinol dehydrogenase [Metallosphaera javensis (ex Hofmann et al. 2022)]BCS91639.1 MAG: histidinol dehydrogenase [Metallosphaera javensis (ex Sakai et al. 2022)]
MIKRELPTRRVQSFSQVLEKVNEITERVRKEGDRALREFALQFDGVKLDELVLGEAQVTSAASKVPPEVKGAIDEIWDQLVSFHELIMPPSLGGGSKNVEYGVLWRPLQRVGIYVPGGKKSYPSTLMMAGIPAKIAGVEEIHVATPVKDELDPAIAYIATKLKVKRIYPVGGAQAIAALAFGTESVTKVDKIVGPGNIYVQAAKYIVSKEVGIDGIEGPTELVVIADETSDPKSVALDLMAQGEHGSSSFLVLMSTSEELLNKVGELLGDENEYYMVRTETLEKAVELANQLAPEHLSLYTSRSRELLHLVKNAGAVTLGNTPPALIDYSAGPDHILPTNGWARFRGGVTVYDFLKPVSYVNAERADRGLVKAAEILAEYEGFRNHARSIGVRYE